MLWGWKVELGSRIRTQEKGAGKGENLSGRCRSNLSRRLGEWVHVMAHSNGAGVIPLGWLRMVGLDYCWCRPFLFAGGRANPGYDKPNNVPGVAPFGAVALF